MLRNQPGRKRNSASMFCVSMLICRPESAPPKFAPTPYDESPQVKLISKLARSRAKRSRIFGSKMKNGIRRCSSTNAVASEVCVVLGPNSRPATRPCKRSLVGATLVASPRVKK